MYLYVWYNSSNNGNSNGSKLFSVRYEPNHKMHINFSLWRVQRETRLETCATGQYALLFLLGYICIVLSRCNLVIHYVYVPLLRDIVFLELPILNQQWKICTAQTGSEPRPHHNITVVCQQCQEQVPVHCAKTLLMIYIPRYTSCNRSFSKKLNKNGKEWNITFPKWQISCIKGTTVYAIPCSFDYLLQIKTF